MKISLRENEKGDHTLYGIAEIMLHAWVVKKEINERPHIPSCGCDKAIALMKSLNSEACCLL